LFLVGTRLGSMLLVDRKTRRDGWRLVMRLAALDVLLWAVTLAVDAYVEPNSRRMVRLPVQCAAALVCVIYTASLTRHDTTHDTTRHTQHARNGAQMNLTYVLSTLAQNLLTLCLVVLVSMLVPPPQRPWDGLIQAINRNQLCVFLAVLALHSHAHAHAHAHTHIPDLHVHCDQPVVHQANLMVGLVNFSMKTLYASDSGTDNLLSLVLPHSRHSVF
jgi:hypothetical protein